MLTLDLDTVSTQEHKLSNKMHIINNTITYLPVSNKLIATVYHNKKSLQIS